RRSVVTRVRVNFTQREVVARSVTTGARPISPRGQARLVLIDVRPSSLCAWNVARREVAARSVATGARQISPRSRAQRERVTLVKGTRLGRSLCRTSSWDVIVELMQAVTRRRFLALGAALPILAAWAPRAPDRQAIRAMVRSGISGELVFGLD